MKELQGRLVKGGSNSALPVGDKLKAEPHQKLRLCNWFTVHTPNLITMASNARSRIGTRGRRVV